MLEGFDPTEINQVMGEVADQDIITRHFSDFPDPGPEVDEGRIELEEISALEAIIPSEYNLLPVHFLDEGAVRQRAVARMIVPGLGKGTGFMVSKTLLLTNNHVLPNKTLAKRAYAQFNYQFSYTGAPQAIDTFYLDPDRVFYTNAALDFTLVRVKPRCK